MRSLNLESDIKDNKTCYKPCSYPRIYLEILETLKVIRNVKNWDVRKGSSSKKNIPEEASSVMEMAKGVQPLVDVLHKDETAT